MIKLKRVITPTNGDSIRSMDNETLALFLSLMMRGRAYAKENISLNGDSIRSMDNETLALLLSLMMRGRGCTKENISLQNTLDWLQQPVKEDVESLVSPFQKHHELFYTEKECPNCGRHMSVKEL